LIRPYFVDVSAVGILLASISVKKTGQVQVIDISMFETAVSWLGYFPHHIASGEGRPASACGIIHHALWALSRERQEICRRLAGPALGLEIFCRQVIARPDCLDDAKF